MPPVTSASLGSLPVLDLYPPVSHDSTWWWVVLGCLVAAAAVLWGCRRVLTRIDVAATAGGPATLETIRATALRALDAAAEARRRGEPDRTVCRGISLALRRFAALACGSDLDYEGLDELCRHARRIRGWNRSSRSSNGAMRWSSTRGATASTPTSCWPMP